jgi:hypothetical protein
MILATDIATTDTQGDPHKNKNKHEVKNEI